MHRFVVHVALLLLPLASANAGDRELWLYYPTNLLVNENIDKAEQIWTRAAEAGYTHVLLADSKFSRLNEMEQRYFDNVDRVKVIGQKLKLKIVPAVFAIGYSNDLLSQDPNLAEGLPARETPFVVQGGEGRVHSEEPVKLEKLAFADPAVKIDGSTAIVSPHEASARMTYTLKLPKYRCYHLSVDVKTDAYTGTPEIKALGNSGRSLQWQSIRVQPTQDWTTHHVVFNSLDSEEVNVYFGVWGGAQGSLQWRNWNIEEVCLLNVLRRPGTPLEVTTAEGKKLVEGKDFERIEDPKMGNDPWMGEYVAWHEPPTIKTSLPDGTRLKVSWYHPAIIYSGQVSACIAEPKTNDVLADQAARMKKAWGSASAGWMMNHDEFRTLGWCKACEKTGKTPGEMLAENVSYCINLLKPDPIYVWSDMFDPHHNAVEGPYYLVKGPWTGSWEGLSSDVVIMNWNQGGRAKSLPFFAERGHKQIIATYYDDPSLGATREWLETARPDPSVIGFMYTTWTSNYDHIEAFAELCGD